MKIMARLGGVVCIALIAQLSTASAGFAYNTHTNRAYAREGVYTQGYSYIGIGDQRPDTTMDNSGGPCGKSTFDGGPGFLYEDMWLVQDNNFNHWAEFFTSDTCETGARQRCWGVQLWVPDSAGHPYERDHNDFVKCGVTNAVHRFYIVIRNIPGLGNVWDFQVDNTVILRTGADMFVNGAGQLLPGQDLQYGLETNIRGMQYAPQNWTNILYIPNDQTNYPAYLVGQGPAPTYPVPEPIDRVDGMRVGAYGTTLQPCANEGICPYGYP